MAPLLPAAPSGVDGSNAENKFHILHDVTITGNLTLTLTENHLKQANKCSGFFFGVKKSRLGEASRGHTNALVVAIAFLKEMFKFKMRVG